MHENWVIWGGVFVLLALLFPSEGGRMQVLSSECKLTKLILWSEQPSNHLTSKKKATLICKLSAQLLKSFNQLI